MLNQMQLLQKGWQVVPRAALLAIKERHERGVKGRQATKSDKKAFAAGTLINKGPAALAAADDDQYPKVSTSLPVTSPHPVAFPATAALDQRRGRRRGAREGA